MNVEALDLVKGDPGFHELTLEYVNSIRKLDEYLGALMDFSEQLEFSDVMLESDGEISFRVPSGWRPTGYGVVTELQLKETINWLREADANGLVSLDEKPRTQLSVSLGKWRLRCTIFTTGARFKTKVIIRKLPESIPDLSKLGLGVLVRQLVSAYRGLVIVSGPTGTGKSTTMAAILQKMLDTRPIHAVTIEHPIEYVFSPGMGLVSQREVGSDVESFEQGLNEALRQTPDAILVGEVRTREEAETAFRAAEHGRFVLMSTHGRDAVSAIQKLLSFFPADEQRSKAAMLSNHLVCVIHQALLPSVETNKWELAYESFFKGDKPEIAGLLADPDKYPQLRTMLASGEIQNSISMNRVLAKLVSDKKVTQSEAQAATVDVAGLMELLGKAGQK